MATSPALFGNRIWHNPGTELAVLTQAHAPLLNVTLFYRWRTTVRGRSVLFSHPPQRSTQLTSKRCPSQPGYCAMATLERSSPHWRFVSNVSTSRTFLK